MAPSRLQAELFLGPAGAPSPRRRPAAAPLRMLLLADLGGTARAALAQRQPQAVDIDSFDALFARVRPGLTLEVDGRSATCGFATLDDFHPDALLARLPLFDELRRLRDELQHAAQLPRVAAALGLAVAQHGTPAPAPASPADTADAAADVQRLLGRPLGAVQAPASPPAPLAPAAPMQDALQRWLHALVAPHVQPDLSAQQGAVREALDAALGTLMRRVLHAPRLQALEAAWRAIDGLVRGLELGDDLQLWVLDIGRAEIDEDIAAHEADLQGSCLHRWLCGGTSPDRGGWGLWVVDQAFGPAPGDVHTLAALGALAARAGAPVLAAALPQTVGAAGLAQLHEPATWLAADDPALAHWAALRASPMAPWIGLALPRVLLRLPYGGRTDPVAGFDFDEMPVPPEHGAYLWGLPGAALALLAGRAYRQDGWPLALDAQRLLDDLPAHVVPVDGQPQLQPCAEVWLDERAATAMAARGPMPLMSWKDRPAASLLRWQSLAHPAAALNGLGA